MRTITELLKTKIQEGDLESKHDDQIKDKRSDTKFPQRTDERRDLWRSYGKKMYQELGIF